MAKQRTAEARKDMYWPCCRWSKKAENGLTEIEVLEATDYHNTSRGQKPNGATSGLFSFNNVAMGWNAIYAADSATAGCHR